MRVLYFSRDYTTHDYQFLLELGKTKNNIFYLRLENDGIPYESRSLPEGIHYVEWKGGKKKERHIIDWLNLMLDFDNVISKIKPDLIHAGPVQSCGFMTSLSNFKPFLLMSWGSDILVDSKRNKCWKWITRYTLEHSDVLLCDSQIVREKVKEIMPYEDNRIIQFPWGVDLQQFSPGKDKLGLRKIKNWKDSFIVISTRTWEKIYGVDTLLKAFCHAYNNNSKLRLILLGTGSMSDEIDNIIENNNLIDVVYRPGQVLHSELPEYFRSADLYMSCSSCDGTSISMLEAMATGLPILVSDLPGNREWIRPGENGWLASEGNVESFKKLLIYISHLEEKERKKISSLNRNIVKERADWNKNFHKLFDAYDILKKKFI